MGVSSSQSTEIYLSRLTPYYTHVINQASYTGFIMGCVETEVRTTAKKKQILPAMQDKGTSTLL
jgi:hypothetical protein